MLLILALVKMAMITEITLLFFIFLGVIGLHCVFHLRPCEVKSGNAREDLLMCAKHVQLVKAKGCDLVCKVGRVI